MNKRICILVVMVMFLATSVYGEIEYTYEKVNNKVMKIREVEITTRIGETNITIKSLRERLTNLEITKAEALNHYNERISRLNVRITFIENQIAEAKSLGIIEAIK